MTKPKPLHNIITQKVASGLTNSRLFNVHFIPAYVDNSKLKKALEEFGNTHFQNDHVVTISIYGNFDAEEVEKYINSDEFFEEVKISE